MKVLYLDCQMGAAGDMLTAALYDLLDEKQQQEFVDCMNQLPLKDVSFQASKIKRSGILGTQVKVEISGKEEGEHAAHTHGNGEEHHTSLEEIRATIDRFDLPQQVKTDAIAVYELLAQAESVVHGIPVTDIHFHEVGRLDAIVDITAVCYLMQLLQPERVMASPVCVGSGMVRCDHGILPVPAPAVAYLLQGIPMYSGKLETELCTPTGAALLRYFVDDYDDMPIIRTQATGYGIGKKEFAWLNAVRAFYGEMECTTQDEIVSLSCNVDDMTGESVGFATEQILAAGAKEVFTVPIQMKKNRPGILLTVFCHPEDEELMVRKIFQYTTTIGIRKQSYERYVLDRQEVDLETQEGVIRRKEVEGFGVSRSKLEYEDVARVARKYGISIEEAKRRLLK